MNFNFNVNTVAIHSKICTLPSEKCPILEEVHCGKCKRKEISLQKMSNIDTCTPSSMK